MKGPVLASDTPNLVRPLSVPVVGTALFVMSASKQ